jgi:hypothetical protein
MANDVTSAKAILEKIFNLCEDITSEEKQKLYLYCFKYVDHPVIEATLAKIKVLAPKVTEFLNMLNQCSKNISSAYNKYTTDKQVLIVVPNDPTMLRIYKNITINGTKDLNNANSMSPDILSSFIKEYEADIYRDKKWADINKRLDEYEDMPTARALARYANLGLDPQSATLRDLAIRMDEYRKPMEIKFADTPEDFYIMYGSGPHSCMGYKASNVSSWKHLTDNKMYPSSWYSYYPKTRGAYVIKGNTVLARAILFKQPDGSYRYGRIYYTATEYIGKFQSSLKAMGITQQIGHHKPSINTEFYIPGIAVKGSNTKYAPWPYFDDIDPVFSVEWEKEKNRFRITHSARSVNKNGVPQNGTNGFIRSCDYENAGMCDNCGRTGKMEHTHDGARSFCTTACGVALGYRQITQGNGAARWEIPDEYHVKTTSGLLFSTLQAAFDNGYYVTLNEGKVPEEGDFIVSMEGTSYVCQHGYYVRDREGFGYYPETFPIGAYKEMRNVEYDPEDTHVDIQYAA